MKFLALFCSVMVSLSSIEVAFSEATSASGQLIETCPLPNKPAIPNGRTSSEGEMIEAQTAMKAYIAKGNEVLACLDRDKAKMGDQATEEYIQINTLFYNRMVDEMTSVGDLFNSAVRAYKGKN